MGKIGNFHYTLSKIVRNISLIVAILCSVMLFAQPTPQQIDEKIKMVKDSNYTQKLTSDECLRILLQCYRDSKQINYIEGIKKCGLEISIKYSNVSDCKNSIKISDEIAYLMEKETNYISLVEYHKSKALCYSFLALTNESIREYRKALSITEKISDADEKNYYKSVLYLDLAIYYDKTPVKKADSILFYMQEALKAGENISKVGRLAKKGTLSDWVISLNYYLGNVYLEDFSDVENAKLYFMKAKNLYEISSTKMILLNEITFLACLSSFYLENKEYDNAIKFALKSLELSSKENVVSHIKRRIYQNLAESYLKKGLISKHQLYMNKYLSFEDITQMSLNKESDDKLKNEIYDKEKEFVTERNKIIFIIFIILTGLLVASALIWREHQKKIHKNYLLVIEKIINKEAESGELTKKENSNLKTIPTETYQRLVSKLNRFEKNLGFLKKDSSLSSLATQFDTNSRSLSLVINAEKGKTLSVYINELRINYITQKLYEDPSYRMHKIIDLAEECGFSSPKVFTSVFKKINGMTPSFYIEQLQLEK